VQEYINDLLVNWIIVEDNNKKIYIFASTHGIQNNIWKYLFENNANLYEIFKKISDYKKYEFFEIQNNVIKFKGEKSFYFLFFHSLIIWNVHLLKYCLDILFTLKNNDKNYDNLNELANSLGNYLFSNMTKHGINRDYSEDYKIVNNLYGSYNKYDDVWRIFMNFNFEVRNYQTNFFHNLLTKNNMLNFLPVGFGKSSVIIPLKIYNFIINDNKNKYLIISVPEHLILWIDNDIIKTCLFIRGINYKYILYNNFVNNIEDFENMNFKIILLLWHSNLKLLFMDKITQMEKIKNWGIDMLIDEMDDFFNPLTLN